MEPNELQNHEFSMEETLARLRYQNETKGFATATSTATVKKIAIVDIVSMGKNIGFDVDSEDIEELGEDHCTEFITKELVHLQNEQQDFG